MRTDSQTREFGLVLSLLAQTDQRFGVSAVRKVRLGFRVQTPPPERFKPIDAQSWKY